MSLGALAFLNPWLLAALAALPVIYWLLRTVPPSPQRINFPATRILVGLENTERTPAKTPWWLTLIRMLAAALVILALAEPVLNPSREKGLRGSGPVVLVVDNGWSAASHWSERSRLLERLIAEAEAQSRPVMVVATAPASKTQTVKVEAPATARSTAAAIQPQPFEPNRQAAMSRIEAAIAGAAGASVVWLTDGIDHGNDGRQFADKLVALAGSTGSAAVVEVGAAEQPLGLVSNTSSSGKLQVRILQATGNNRDGFVHAFSARGQRLGEVPFRLGAGDTSTTSVFDIPLEIRNQVTRVEVAGERSAGAVNLLDARSQWHRIGLVTGESLEQAQPLLAPLYYVQRALAPYAELVLPKDANAPAVIDEALKRNVTVLVLADIGTLAGELKTKVEKWVSSGGVLVRFAGPRLEKGGDELLPVPLRLGGRTLGGALSWSAPQPLAPLPDDGLFAGLAVPKEVLVRRQVLADPARLTNDVKVWARLTDGTPLVTASKLGEGQIVLFHVTANSDWSNLPLSGLFVEMLRRLGTLGKLGGSSETAAADVSGTTGAISAEVLAPSQTLDGFGVLRAPPATAQAIAFANLATAKPSADHPPGYYGPAGSPRAFNVLGLKSELKPLGSLPSGFDRRAYQGESARPLKPSFLGLALALLLIDVVAVLLLQAGPLWRRRASATATTAALAALLGGTLISLASPTTAVAQTPAPRADAPPVRVPGGPPRTRDEQNAMLATSKVTLAYVVTGNASVDDTSHKGLIGLGRILNRRTAVEPGEPFGVNIATDEVAFYPVLYWPVLADAQALPEATLAKIDAYMKQGGMIVFDTRDAGSGIPTGVAVARGGTALQRLLGRLDIPRLEHAPEGHVMTKSFYLLRTFPGRYDSSPLWVEAENAEGDSERGRHARRVDGVSSLMITGNDLAGAWATDERERGLFSVSPGGEQQREMAFRVGVNIVMYALTGNYKADQVHIPALLERLGN